MSNSQRRPSISRLKRAKSRFVTCLEELTRRKKVRWVRSSQDRGIVLCRIGDEIIEFEASDGTPADVDGEVGGIVCTFRSFTWLWLTPLPDGGRLLTLLRNAKIDDSRFRRWSAAAYRSGLELLEDALADDKD